MTRTRGDARATVILPSRRAAIRRRLLGWYDRNRRDLPWRRRGLDPYAQWVAEVMLQQTRVETVAAYYDRFLRRFPTIASLARANHETVLKHWEGLGYYRRALHLHEAARRIHERGGIVPSTVSELRALPGVGEYIAAAVASIAFGVPVAAVDGNVARVVARLFGVTDDVLSSRGKAAIDRLAAQLIPRARPGDFNQAWMDLGSLICTPRSPDCSQCPLATVCVAASTERTNVLPVRAAGGGRRPVDLSYVVGIFVRGARMLVRRRPTGGLWSGLWEFPTAERDERSPVPTTLDRLAREHDLAVTTTPQAVPSLRHQLTHRSLTFFPFTVVVDTPPTRKTRSPYRWVTRQGFQQLSVSTAHRRIFAAAEDIVMALMQRPQALP